LYIFLVDFLLIVFVPSSDEKYKTLNFFFLQKIRWF
jgi:hypothetical protein